MLLLEELEDTLSSLSISSPSSSSSLQENGYEIIDNLFPSSLLQQLKDEIEFLHHSDWMEPSGNILELSPSSPTSPSPTPPSQERKVIKIKPNVYERSLVMRNKLIAGLPVMNFLPTLSQFWDGKQYFLNLLSRHTGVQLRALDQIKVAVIEQNGSFMIHTDSTPVTYESEAEEEYGSESYCERVSRVMTMTLYLNQMKEDYSAEDGGFLRIYPLLNSTDPQIIDIAPIFGRAVLFSSTNLPHRVMPSKSTTRYCISFFFYGTTSLPFTSLTFKPSNLSNQLLNLFQNQYPSPTTPTSPSSLVELEKILLPLLLELRSRYSSLCPLLFQSEYSQSIFEAFSTAGTDSEEVDIHSAVKQFHFKCDEYRKTLDENLLKLVDILVSYVHTKEPLQVL